MPDASLPPYLVLGAGGMLGTAMTSLVVSRNGVVSTLSRSELDITDETAIDAAVSRFAAQSPEGIVVNCAAYTDVERAESDAAGAFQVNESGPGLIAMACVAHGVRLVHVSTDFVFDGSKQGAYSESDSPDPLNVYGASKLAGEHRVLAVDPGALVVRTAWVYGPSGVNFPSKILQAAESRPLLRVVEDEVGSPTYTIDLAEGITRLVARGACGVFHLTGRGSCSRYEFACELLRLSSKDVTVEPVASSEFASSVSRPKNSVLDCSKAAGLDVVLPEWRDALKRYLPAREAMLPAT